jgi:hypothetical protein
VPAWRPVDATVLGVNPGEVVVFEALILILGLLACGVLVAGMEAFNAWRDRRIAEIVGLRDRIVTALQRKRRLKHFAVTPVVHVPLWGQSRATIELRGQLPTHRLRAAVRRTAAQEAARFMARYRIHDRLVVVRAREAKAG